MCILILMLTFSVENGVGRYKISLKLLTFGYFCLNTFRNRMIVEIAYKYDMYIYTCNLV